MKTTRKKISVRIAEGRKLSSSETAHHRHHYHFALLCKKGDMGVRSWKNFDWEDYHSEGFTQRVAALATEFHASGAEYALITLSKAPTPAEGLALIPLNDVELRKFYQRHPRHTLKVIATFGPADGTPAREYIGTVVGGEGFCTNENRISEA